MTLGIRTKLNEGFVWAFAMDGKPISNIKICSNKDIKLSKNDIRGIIHIHLDLSKGVCIVKQCLNKRSDLSIVWGKMLIDYNFGDKLKIWELYFALSEKSPILARYKGKTPSKYFEFLK